MTADAKRGEELAELAREFLLWLQTNQLPDLPGLGGKDGLVWLPDSNGKVLGANAFAMSAGIYRKAVDLPWPSRKLSPLLWADEPKELSRLHDLNRGVQYVLLVSDPQATRTLPDGRQAVNNFIVQVNRRLTQPGAMMTVDPTLDSLRADDATRNRVEYVTFCSVLRRTDLVYDDVETARALRFKYPQLVDYQPPRAEYDVHVHDVPIPMEVVTDGRRTLPPHIAAQRVREFREYLYHTATYRNREYVNEEGGKYYRKYRDKNPVSKDKRVFVPTKLSKEYIEINFFEPIMKKGDNLLLLEVGNMRYVYRLLRDRKGHLVVDGLMALGNEGPPVKPGEKPVYSLPIKAVFFHALDGAKNLPTEFRFGNLDYHGPVPKRLTYNYKAALRWYYNDPQLRFADDAEWFSKFVEVFFGDQSYAVDATVGAARAPTRERLFLNALKQSAADAAPGPIKDRLNDLVKWCHTYPNFYFFTQGMRLGKDDNPRELIGIINGNVFEWHPRTGRVTIIEFTQWLNEIGDDDLAADVYRSTAGMLPFITLITWGGVAVITGGVLVAKFTLGTVAREAVRQLVGKVVGSRIAKKAAKEAVPFLISALAAGAMNLIPKQNELVWHFCNGFFHGFGGGAVEHYLSEFDERLERTVKKAPAMVANYVTKNGYTAYVIYDKVRAAVIRITGVVQSLRTVLTDKRAKLVADKLNEFSQYAGMAFVVILFVVVYMDWVHRSRPKFAAEEWARKQQQNLKWMIESTGNEVLAYSRKVRDEIASLTLKPDSAEAAAVVRKHDQTLRATIKGLLDKGITAVPAVAEFLSKLMKDMGIDDWDDLEKLGIMEVLHRGVGALPTKGLANDQVERLGKAVGELIGTFMLERAVVPKSAERDTGLLFDKRQTARATKTTLAGGGWRAVWRFVIHPFENLRNLPAGLAKSLTSVTDPEKNNDGHAFSHLAKRESAYARFIGSLVADEEELARRLAKLASDSGLEAKLQRMIASVVEGKTPPVLKDLLKKEDDAWPTEAIMFLLYSWMRFGLHQLLEAFALIDDDKDFDGVFKLSQLLDILGLDIALDDNTLQRLMTTFSKRTGKP